MAVITTRHIPEHDGPGQADVADSSKTCTLCNTEKPTTEFNRVATRPDGLHPWCKPCRSTKGRTDRQANRQATRACPRCGEEFSGTSATYCRGCGAEAARESRKRIREADPERAHRAKKNDHLKHQFGITLAEYERILAEQGGGCAICQTTLNTDGRKLAVDHCHESGRIRGILCSRCNFALGQFADRVDLLESAIRYLTEASESAGAPVVPPLKVVPVPRRRIRPTTAKGL